MTGVLNNSGKNTSLFVTVIELMKWTTLSSYKEHSSKKLQNVTSSVRTYPILEDKSITRHSSILLANRISFISRWSFVVCLSYATTDRATDDSSPAEVSLCMAARQNWIKCISRNATSLLGLLAVRRRPMTVIQINVEAP